MYMKRPVLRIGLLVYRMILITSLLSTSAHAATYYLSPVGSDAQSGTSSSSPWKTFAYAIPRLAPGDTLRLLNGTYTKANSGLPDVICGSNATNGTSAQPITVTAHNERQAKIQSDGSDAAIYMKGCAYWTVQGIVFTSTDSTAGGSSYLSIANIVDTNHLIMRRNIFARNNRYQNTHGALDQRGNSNLWEDNEFYWLHRHGLALSNTSYNTLRRNYFHSRGYADIPGGKVSGMTDRGDDAISCYPCNNTIIENNITEGFGTGIALVATTNCHNNKVYGDISLNEYYAIYLKARDDRGNSLDGMPRDTYIKDTVVIGPRNVGFYWRTTKNAHCDNCTVLDTIGSGIILDVAGTVRGDGAPTGFMTNLLVAGSDGRGIQVSEYSQWSMDKLILYNNTGGYSPGLTDGHYSNVSQANPNLGTCRVYIPQGSPAKGAGVGGADIGANVLYRYVNGVLTKTPLWDPATSRFPCGAQVAGVNDIAGSSCFDVHKRLNVNTNGCMLPTLGSPPPTSAFPRPTNLQILGSQP